MRVLAIGPRTRVVEIWPAIVARFVRSKCFERDQFTYGCADRPLKGIDRANDQYRLMAVPSDVAKNFAAVLGGLRREGPRSVGTEFGGNSELAQYGAGFLISRNDQRVLAETGAHFSYRRVHLSGFAAIADRQFVLRRRKSQRTDHHRGERVGKLALEHRALTSYHAVMLRDFTGKKWRENVRQVHLARVFEVAVCKLKALAHDAEVHVVRAEHVTQLANHFFNTRVRSHIARAVVSGKQELQFLARRPAFALAQHPCGLFVLDDRADPGLQHEIHHAADPPA